MREGEEEEENGEGGVGLLRSLQRRKIAVENLPVTRPWREGGRGRAVREGEGHAHVELWSRLREEEEEDDDEKEEEEEEEEEEGAWIRSITQRFRNREGGSSLLRPPSRRPRVHLASSLPSSASASASASSPPTASSLLGIDRRLGGREDEDEEGEDGEERMVLDDVVSRLLGRGRGLLSLGGPASMPWPRPVWPGGASSSSYVTDYPVLLQAEGGEGYEASYAFHRIKKELPPQ
jgi:hypothetical protein